MTHFRLDHMAPQKRSRDARKKTQGDGPSASVTSTVPTDGCEVEMMDEDDSDSDESENDLTFDQRDEGSDDSDDEDDAMDSGASKAASTGDRSVNVEFVFSDPREVHFHSVKQFLISYLPPTQPFDVSGMADTIVNQVETGTMVCVEGEQDVYGFITALGLQRYQQVTSMQQVLQYVAKKCPPSELARFQGVLNAHSVALVINERMVNLPYQLVPAIHSALHEDIEWAIENEESEPLRKSFDVEYFLILSSCTVEKAGASFGKSKGKKTKTQYEQTAKFFSNFEDEFLEPEADVSFSFDTPRGERERVDNAHRSTVVMLIKRSTHKAALASISAMINA